MLQELLNISIEDLDLKTDEIEDLCNQLDEELAGGCGALIGCGGCHSID